MATRLLLAGALALGLGLNASGALACSAFTGLQPELAAEGLAFSAGDRVVIVKQAGTFKPADTAHANEVIAEPDRTGEFLGAVPREAVGLPPAKPGVPLQIACVRFDAQAWFDTEAQASVDLPAFEATIHSSFLRGAR